MSGVKTLFGLSMLISCLTFAGYAIGDSGGLTKINVKIEKGKEATPGKMVCPLYWLIFPTESMSKLSTR